MLSSLKITTPLMAILSCDRDEIRIIWNYYFKFDFDFKIVVQIYNED
jgi:hypothetical protein